MIAREFGRSVREVRDEWSAEDFLDAERFIASESYGKRKANEKAARQAKGK